MLQIKDVTRRFGTRAAVDRVSFGIDGSAIVGIIGAPAPANPPCCGWSTG